MGEVGEVQEEEGRMRILRASFGATRGSNHGVNKGRRAASGSEGARPCFNWLFFKGGEGKVCRVSVVPKCANGQLGLNVARRVCALEPALAAKSQLRSAIIGSFRLQSSVSARLV